MGKLNMNDIKNINILKCFDTLKETSSDKHDGKIPDYMTDSLLNVINFDKVKDKYIENLSVPETPASNDVLYIDDNKEMYFIEFKNGYMDSKKIFEVRLKIFDSLLILTDIIKKGVSFTREELNYILVYNETKNPLTDNEIKELRSIELKLIFAKHFAKKSEKNFIRFSLRRFKTLYFKNVFTLTEDEFKNEFVKKWDNYAD